MNVSLTSNFLLNARGFTLLDGGGITWSINKNTNSITATAGSAGTATTANNLAAGSTNQIPYQTGAGVTSFFSAANYGVQIYGSTGVPSALPGAAGVLQGSAVANPAFTTTPTLTGTNFSGIPYAALTGTPSIPVGANPSATFGVDLAGANGSATSWLRSDVVLKLNPAISPTWTGSHTFAPLSGNSQLNVNAVAGSYAAVNLLGNGQGSGLFLFHYTDNNCYIAANEGSLNFQIAGVTKLSIATSGAITASGKFAINGNSPPAQVTGWGTPTGGTVVNNFAAGATPSLLQLSEAVAQIISDLKAFGLYGA